MAALPTQVEELTADWLEGALSERFPGTRVGEVEVESVIWGTATKVFLRAGYSAVDEDGPPPELCVKGGFQEELRALASGGYQVEARFYREIAPRLGDAVPRCWFAEVDTDREQGIVILDDLRAAGAGFGTPSEPWGPDRVAAALELQAAWHAPTWDRRGLEPAGWLTVGSPLFRAVASDWLGEEHWNRFLGLPQTEPLDETLRDRERVGAALRRSWELDDSATLALSHGDPHVGNTYIDPSGTPAFLDWQTACLAPWVDDVTYFVVGAMSVDARREHERVLLEHYLGALRAAGAPAPSAAGAWSAYRQHQMHGLIFAFCPPEMQSPDVCRLMAERYGAAATDHETLGLLEETLDLPKAGSR